MANNTNKILDLKRSLAGSCYEHLLEHEYTLTTRFMDVQDLEFEAWDSTCDVIQMSKDAGESWIPLLVHDDIVVDGYHRFAAWICGRYGIKRGNDKIEILEMKKIN